MIDPATTEDPPRWSEDCELSSFYYFYWYRYVLPAGLLGIVLVDLAARALQTGWDLLPGIFRVAAAVAAAVFFVRGRQLKRVYWRGDHLQVSDGRTSISIRPGDIAEVTTSNHDPPRMHLLLHSATPFGTQITFIPHLGGWVRAQADGRLLSIEEGLRTAAAENLGLPPPARPEAQPPWVVALLVVSVAASAIWLVFTDSESRRLGSDVIRQHLAALERHQTDAARALLTDAARSAPIDRISWVLEGAHVGPGARYDIRAERAPFDTAEFEVTITNPPDRPATVRYILNYEDDHWRVANVRRLR